MRRSTRWAGVTALLIGIVGPTDGVWAQQSGGATAELAGVVHDENGAPVAGATVALFRVGAARPAGRTGTDENGAFRFERAPTGDFTLVFQRLGFVDLQRDVSLSAGSVTNLEIRLTVDAVLVDGITVRGVSRSREAIAFDELAGMTVRAIEAAELKNLPGLAEADPMRAAAIIPGVTTTSDFSAAFNVRGGSADQNLILLDGIPIYNPSHLGGVFSVFNPDMVRRAELKAGGFPAEYGGRVSSVLSVESDLGSGEELQFQGAVSMLSGRIAANGGLGDSVKARLGLNDARWRVAARRSYVDLLVAPFADFPYKMYDVHSAFEGWTRGGDRISFVAYNGEDVLDMSSTTEDIPLRLDWDFGNEAFGGRWTRLRRRGGVIDVRAGYSRFKTGLRLPDFEDSEFESRIEQGFAALDVEARPSRNTRVKTGGEVRYSRYRNRLESGGTEFLAGKGDGVGVSGYSQGTYRSPGGWVAEAGVRLDTWMPGDLDAYVELSPRLAIKRRFADDTWAIKAAAGRYTQFLHSNRNEEVPLGFDMWVLTGEEAPAIVSDQIQGGLEFSSGEWFASVEGFARDFDGVITQNTAEDPNVEFDELLSGRGHAYGVDLFVKHTRGSSTSWLSVGWLKARRTFENTESGLVPAPEIEFAPIFDRRWDIDLLFTRPLGDRTEVGVRWNYGSGLLFTRPTGSFPHLTPRGNGGQLDAGTEDGDIGVILGPKNGSRYPANHRLDLNIRRRYERSWGSFTPYLSVINAYNHQNILFYLYEYEKDPAVRGGTSMFPVVPTFGVEVTFR